jgi:hypothetical protein
MSQKRLTHFEASLVIEALTPSDVRSSHFKQAWSRLFSAGDYFIDLAFEMKPEFGELRGQVLLPSASQPVNEGKIRLSCKNQTVAESNLDASGTFLLNLRQTGEHQLTVKLKKTLLNIQSVEFQ